MRIGVLTFYWSQDNYGQLLQAYALQRYLREAGHDAFLIRYVGDVERQAPPLLPRVLKAFNPLKLLRHIYGRYSQWQVSRAMAAHSRQFDDFRARYLRMSERMYSHWPELRDDPPEADCYIVGSDQVWNFGGDEADIRLVRNMVHGYFLDFGPVDIPRLSYAASWSVHALPAALREEIRPLLARFGYISVREQEGIDLCAQCGRPDAVWVPDPTFLLTAEQYREIYQQEGVTAPERPYVFLYMLNRSRTFPLEVVYDWARSRGLEVVLVTGNRLYTPREVSYLTIPEWLAYLDGASAVLTDSFHCTVFSSFFQRPYGVIPIEGVMEGMNTRIETLCSFTGQPRRYVRTVEDLHWLTEPVQPQMESNRDNLAQVLAGLKQ